MVGLIRQVLYPALSKVFSRATLVEGRLKGTQHPFRCLLVCTSDFGDYLKTRMYEDPPAVLRRSYVWIPALRRAIRTNPDRIDLCVAVLPRFYDSIFHGLCDYKCTEFIRQVIDISGTWEDIRSRFSKTKRQITNRFVDKYGLGYRISNDQSEFDFFYHRMFAPHIKKRFGGLSIIDSYEDMRKFFLKGRLLLVTKAGEPVAGALFLVEDGTLVFRRTGVLDGDETHIEGGGQLALYYFQLKYANEHKLRAVDTMLSSPFLNDGVYVNKKEWGAAVLPDEHARNWVYFFGALPSEKIAHFFEKNPIIVHSQAGLRGVIGAPGTADVSDESVKELVRRYQARGLAGFTVVTPTRAVAASGKFGAPAMQAEL